MKNNTPPVSEPVSPLIWKLILIGGGILVMVMLVLTVRSIIGILRPSPSPSAAVQTDTTTATTHPQLPLETAPSSGSGSSEPAALPSSQRANFVMEAEIMCQREQARTETIEALKREALEQAGTAGVPKEVLQKLEHSNPILY